MSGFIKSAFKLIALGVALLLLNACSKESVLDDISVDRVSLFGGEEYVFKSPVSDQYTHFWEFGDGITSTEVNPKHFYTLSGFFTVNLTLYKGDRLIGKATPYLVDVKQIYRPNIFGVKVASEDLDFVYTGMETYIDIAVSEEIKNVYDNSYLYTMSINGTEFQSYQPRFNITFSVPGIYNCEFTLTDKYGGKGKLDTTLNVGGNRSILNLRIPDANLTPLGTVSERYLIVYEDETWEYQGDLNDFLDYPGPSVDRLIKNGKLMDYYSSGYFYWDFEPFNYKELATIGNNSQFSIDAPAYDLPYTDFNELRVFLVLVGSNAIGISQTPINITPGLETEVIDLTKPNVYYY